MSKISNNLVELRAVRGNTQEELSKYLNVSIQAVDKWESGEEQPQIEYLPNIAKYYQISVDKLLGADEERKRKRIKQASLKACDACKSNDFETAVETWREMCNEYPCDAYCVAQLMFALIDLFEVSNNIDCLSEIIRIGRELIEHEKADSIKGKIVYLLCISLIDTSIQDEARKYAELAYSIDGSYENIMSEICPEDIAEEHTGFMAEPDEFVKKVMGKINRLNSMLQKYRDNNEYAII